MCSCLTCYKRRQSLFWEKYREASIFLGPCVAWRFGFGGSDSGPWCPRADLYQCDRRRRAVAGRLWPHRYRQRAAARGDLPPADNHPAPGRAGAALANLSLRATRPREELGSLLLSLRRMRSAGVFRERAAAPASTCIRSAAFRQPPRWPSPAREST